MNKEKSYKSQYDPSRDTIGKIYRDLHANSKPQIIEVGDMTNSILPGLVDDINEGIASKPFGDIPWYIMIHEKKDLQMKDALLRRVLHTKYRPWPEDDTTVFWHDPVRGETRFCWSLPHWSDMQNILSNHNLFDANLVKEIKAWKAFDLYFFGFVKDELGKWMANPTWKDKVLTPSSSK